MARAWSASGHSATIWPARTIGRGSGHGSGPFPNYGVQDEPHTTPRGQGPGAGNAKDLPQWHGVILRGRSWCRRCAKPPDSVPILGWGTA